MSFHGFVGFYVDVTMTTGSIAHNNRLQLD